jgi:hypothetical protein
MEGNVLSPKIEVDVKALGGVFALHIAKPNGDRLQKIVSSHRKSSLA